MPTNEQLYANSGKSFDELIDELLEAQDKILELEQTCIENEEMLTDAQEKIDELGGV